MLAAFLATHPTHSHPLQTRSPTRILPSPGFHSDPHSHCTRQTLPQGHSWTQRAYTHRFRPVPTPAHARKPHTRSRAHTRAESTEPSQHTHKTTRGFSNAPATALPPGEYKKANKCNTVSDATPAKLPKLKYITHLAARTDTGRHEHTQYPTQEKRTPAHSQPRHTSSLSLHTNYGHSGHRHSEHTTEHPALRHARRAIPARGMSSEGPRALTCGSLGLRRAELEGERQDQSLSTGHGWGPLPGSWGPAAGKATPPEPEPEPKASGSRSGAAPRGAGLEPSPEREPKQEGR